MTLHSVPIDIYFHMTNHYKKLKNVKSVIDTSSPIAYQKSKSNRQSRPSSRTESSSAKSRTSISSDRFYNTVSKLYHNRNCLSARSHSIPLRPPTRRKSSCLPNFDQDIPTKTEPCRKPCKCLITFLGNSASERVTMNEDDASRKPLKHPMPAPRTKIKSQQYGLKKRTVEHEYLQFSLRIMEDIIRNNLHSNEQMKNVFQNHVEANSGRLDYDKMMQEIKYLKLELNVPEDEIEVNLKEVIPPIKYGQTGSSVPLNPDLNCECKVVRQLPIASEKFMTINNVSTKLKSTVQDDIRKDENEVLLKVTNQTQSVETILTKPQTPLSRLSSVTEKSEISSSAEILKDVAENLEETTEITNVNLNNTEIDFEETFPNSDLKKPRNKILFCDGSKSPSLSKVELSTENHLENNYNENQLPKKHIEDEKQSMLTSDEEIKSQSLNSISDNYVLVAGPVYIPKTHLNKIPPQKENFLIVVPNELNKDRLVLVTRDVAVNTEDEKTVDKVEKRCASINTEQTITKESVSTQYSPDSCKTSDKYLYASTRNLFDFNTGTNVTAQSRNNATLLETISSVDLDCYDLTPERDDNYKNMNTDLILSDKYEIRSNYQIFEVTPQVLSEFYPDNSTQTSEWALPSEDKKEDKVESSLTVILPSDTLVGLESDLFVKDSEEVSSQKTIRNSLEALEEVSPFVEINKISQQIHIRKSNLRNPLSSADSLPIHRDGIEDTIKKRHSLKGVSITVDTSTPDLDPLLIVSGPFQTNSDGNESFRTRSHCSDEGEDDDGKRINSFDILDDIHEIERQPSKLLSMKRVLRSRRSLDKSNEIPIKSKSVMDDVLVDNKSNVDKNSPPSNPSHSSKEKAPSEEVSSEKRVLVEPSCCGLKTKKRKNSTQKNDPSTTSEINKSNNFQPHLAMTTTHLSKGVIPKDKFSNLNERKHNYDNYCTD
ncbi:hypothetical protein FQR65_LT04200 [Abscondita terminalis]|nr:hypothetical protein FQR65_LT04200 [Abscondita terminalis]